MFSALENIGGTGGCVFNVILLFSQDPRLISAANKTIDELGSGRLESLVLIFDFTWHAWLVTLPIGEKHSERFTI